MARRYRLRCPEESCVTIDRRNEENEHDVIVVGAGIAGLYMLHRLRGMGLDAKVFEAGSGVGGTWFWNRYPGARCDIPSMDYSYQFSEELQQEWEWTERYASQPEILAYIEHVADRFDLRDGIQFDTRVEDASFDESTNRWTIRTDDGARHSAPFVVMATGCLSCRNTPEFPGLESFEGETYHTGAWPHEEIDFTGKRVAVIGTGSSGVQSAPVIAEQASHLLLFQRTPNYSVPARNGPLDPEEQRRIKAEYPERRRRNSETFYGVEPDFENGGPSALDHDAETLERIYEEAWERGGTQMLLTFDDLMIEKATNDTAIDFVCRKIREVVDDPEVAEKLIPDQTFGCKRLCVDSGYYEMFNRPNVELVDVRDDAIARIVPSGLELESGARYDVDAIVFATGFDAMTGALLAIDPVGRGGVPLHARWAEGPRTLLGLAVNGFPNLFTITGPFSPSVLANMVPAIEQHVEWISDCIGYLRENGFARIEATEKAESEWIVHVSDVANATLFPQCNSWYVGSNIPGKPRVFMPYLGYAPYVERCNEIAEKGYEGFDLSR